MSTSFYVIMQKRSDKKMYVDLHKTNMKIYLDEESALADLQKYYDERIRFCFHVVHLVANLYDDWKQHFYPIEYLDNVNEKSKLREFETLVRNLSKEEFDNELEKQSDGDVVRAIKDSITEDYLGLDGKDLFSCIVPIPPKSTY